MKVYYKIYNCVEILGTVAYGVLGNFVKVSFLVFDFTKDFNLILSGTELV